MSEKVYLRDGQTLVIHDLEVRNAQIVELFKHRAESEEDLEEFLLALLEIGSKAAEVFTADSGARLIQGAVTNAHDGINQSVSNLIQNVDSKMRQITDEEGPLAVNIGQTLEKFKRDVELSIAGEDAPIRKAILDRLNEALEQSKKDTAASLETQRQTITRMLNPEADESPLRVLNNTVKDVQSTLNDVQEKIIGLQNARVARETQSAKGVDFESNLQLKLEEICLGPKDLDNNTGSTRGSSGTMKGDLTVDLNTDDTKGIPQRIVWECKATKKTIADIRGEVREGIVNRDAHVGIAAFDINKRPTGVVDDFTPYDDWAVVVVDRENPDINVVRIAHIWARWRLTRTVNSNGDAIDADAVNEILLKLRGKLSILKEIKKNHGGIAAGLRLADKNVKVLEVELAAELDDLDNLVNTQVDPNRREAQTGYQLSDEEILNDFVIESRPEIAALKFDDERDLEIAATIKLGQIIPALRLAPSNDWIESVELSPRSENALLKHFGDSVKNTAVLADLTVGQLLEVPGLGGSSILDMINYLIDSDGRVA